MWTGRSHAGTAVMSCPSIQTRPAVGVSNPAIMRRSVVLPQPEPPRREKISPFSIVKETLSTARKVPKLFETPSTRTKGAGAWPARVAVVAKVPVICCIAAPYLP